MDSGSDFNTRTLGFFLQLQIQLLAPDVETINIKELSASGTVTETTANQQSVARRQLDI